MNGLGIGQHILLVQGTGQIIPLDPPTARPSVTSHRHVASSEEEKNIGDEVNGENASKEYVNKGPEPMVDSDGDVPDLDSTVPSESGEDDAQNIDTKSNMESNLPAAACTEVNKDGELKHKTVTNWRTRTKTKMQSRTRVKTRRSRGLRFHTQPAPL